MYIPIGPSKKDLYKIIIGLLLVVYVLFLGIYKPKAAVTTPQSAALGGYHTYTTTESDYIKTVNMFNNYGQGYVLFTLFTEMTTFQSQYQVGRNVRAVQIEADNGNWFQCEIGNNGFYLDNSYYDSIISVKCPVNLGTLKQIKVSTTLDKPRVMEIFVQFSDYITFVPNEQEGVIAAIQALQAQQQAISQQQQQINNNVSNINDSINDSSIDSSSANDLTSNSAFQDSNGLDAIIKAPLNFIQSLTSSTCSSINLTIPYINADVSLPCMSTIYNKALGQQLVNLIALVINGVVLYRYCLKILQLVHNAKNPNKDELEVLDL